MNKIATAVLVCAVVAAAFFLRFYKVTQDPPSLNWDETSIGYNAYSILKTGKDEWGEKLPLHFRSYGEYKLPVQVYASIPGIAVFGLNELGVRITPVVYGTLTVLTVYFLAVSLFGNRWMGIISSFLLAISPWHIHLTRASFESGFSVFWVTLGALFFIKGFKNKKYWILSLIPFVISIYTYNAARVFTPLFVFVLFLIYRKEILSDFKIFFTGLGFFIVSMIPLLSFYLSGEATARLKLVSITDDPGFVLRINEARGNSNLPGFFPRLIHNKVTHFAYVFSGNYLSHFSPEFLFINGAPHKQHHVQNVGQFYLWQLPFILAGIYYLFDKKHRHRWLIVFWILLAFIPVSITIDSIPNALRTILAVIPYEIVCAMGTLYLFEKLKDKSKLFKLTAAFSFVFVVVLSLSRYLSNYYSIYPKLYSRDWQYGYKQTLEYVKTHYDEYDLIVFSRTYGEPHMFTLFFMNWDPEKYQKDPLLNRFEAYRWVWVLKFDKFYFPDLGDEGTKFEDVKKANPGKKILFIGKKNDFPGYLQRVLTVDFLDGTRAFEGVEIR